MASRPGSEYGAIQQDVALHGIEDAMARIEEFAFADDIEERQSRLRRERTSYDGEACGYSDTPEQVVRRNTLGLAIGCVVNLAHPDSDWQRFSEQLDKRLGRLFVVTPANQYAVEYLSETELEPVLQRRIARARLRSKGKESGMVRGVKDEINRWVQQEIRFEQETESMIFEEDPDLGRLCMERGLDPDNPKWIEADMFDLHDKKFDPRATTLLTSWRDAIFEARGNLGSPSATEASVVIADNHDVHATNRSRIVDMMADKYGLDTRTVADDWQPEFTIFSTTGDKTMAWHNNVRVPAMPLLVPLRSPRAYEVRN